MMAPHTRSGAVSGMGLHRRSNTPMVGTGHSAPIRLENMNQTILSMKTIEGKEGSKLKQVNRRYLSMVVTKKTTEERNVAYLGTFEGV